MPEDYDELKEISLLSSVEAILSAMPADIISRRAVHCHSYARALLHWEQHIRQEIEASKRKNEIIDMDDEFRQLQDIYARIEEPDGVEGMSTKLQILDPEQQILEHKRAGRWTAAQSWYELALAEKPNDRGLQVELLKCLKSSNRFGRTT
jgi:serine/threonine-protein kinase ATR